MEFFNPKNEYCQKHHENENEKHAICKGKSNKQNFTTRNMNVKRMHTARPDAKAN